MAEEPMDTVHQTTALNERRERVFLVFAGVFLGSMTMLNILGITRFVQLGPLQLAVGVLPYPLTFLCTDFISEFYGRKRANWVVCVGLLLNALVLGFLWLGHQLPPVPPAVTTGESRRTARPHPTPQVVGIASQAAFAHPAFPG